jgi:CRISPR-associated protein Cas2
MTVIVTRDVADRFRGFLASCMLEIAPGVYTAPRMNKAVRERVWAVMEEWFNELDGGGIVMTWRDPSMPGGQGILTLGSPRKELFEYNGIYLVRSDVGATAKKA